MAALATIRVQSVAPKSGLTAIRSNPNFRNKVVRAKAGRGSYSRKQKHKSCDW